VRRKLRGSLLPMSALGQKQTLRCVCLMSALPPKADIGTQSLDVRFVPKADKMRRSEGRPIRSPPSARKRISARHNDLIERVSELQHHVAPVGWPNGRAWID
jgi:hypothetical protein